jgi:hypothetical protein
MVWASLSVALIGGLSSMHWRGGGARIRWLPS